MNKFDFVEDRIFWVYVIIAFFFVIIGVNYIIDKNIPWTVLFLWLVSIVLLLILIYYTKNINSILSIGLFIFLLACSVIWLAELTNDQMNGKQSLFGVAAILGGLILLALVCNKQNFIWLAFFYILIWIILSIYTAINF